MGDKKRKLEIVQFFNSRARDYQASARRAKPVRFSRTARSWRTSIRTRRGSSRSCSSSIPGRGTIRPVRGGPNLSGSQELPGAGGHLFGQEEEARDRAVLQFPGEELSGQCEEGQTCQVLKNCQELADIY